MIYLAVRQKKTDLWAFASEGGTPYKSCADHGFVHENGDDANWCFFQYAVNNSADVKQAPPGSVTIGVEDGGQKIIEYPDGIPSMCQFPGCPKTTLRALVNEVCPMGKHLCDLHRTITAFYAILSFAGGGTAPAQYKFEDET